MDQNETFKIAGKRLDRLWKTTYYKMSSQLKNLETEQAEMLKTFDGHLADVKSHSAQNKMYLQKEPKYLESFDADTNRNLGGKKKILKWMVEQIPKLREYEEYRSSVFNTRKNTSRL